MARHFLLVEKSDMMRKILHTRILANINDAVISEVHSNDEIFEHIEKNPCNLVLSSWDVTDPEGLNLVKNLQQHEKGKAIPCIILIGDDAKYESQVVAAGIKEYLRLPCSPDLFTETINRVCNPVALRRSRRFSPADTLAYIEQRTAMANGKVLNISAGGLLCDLNYDQAFNFAEPMMMSVVLLLDGKDETIEGLFSVMSSLTVIERNADFTAKRLRLGVAFVNTPEATRQRLEGLLEKTEQNSDTSC